MEKIPLIIEFDTATIDEKIKAVIDAKKALDIAIAELDEAAMSITTLKGKPPKN